MCSRYTLVAALEAVEDAVGATFEEPPEPRYNAAPGQSLPIVSSDAPSAIGTMTWGFVPEWADGRADALINARAETVAERESFRAAYRERRCVVPADGFYEWAAGIDGEAERLPYRFTRPDGEPFAMAGIWRRWQPSDRQAGLAEFDGTGPEGSRGGASDAPGPAGPDPVDGFAVLTTEPNDVVADYHDRMPVLLDREDVDAWLDGDEDARQSVLGPDDGPLVASQASRAVNDPANDHPGVLDHAGG